MFSGLEIKKIWASHLYEENQNFSRKGKYLAANFNWRVGKKCVIFRLQTDSCLFYN